MQVYKKMRKQISGIFDPWNFELEPGQRVVDSYDCKKVYDLYESTGWGKRSAGELSYRDVKKPALDAEAIKIKDIWYWSFNA